MAYAIFRKRCRTCFAYELLPGGKATTQIIYVTQRNNGSCEALGHWGSFPGLAVGAVNDIEAINGWNEIDRTVTPDQNSQRCKCCSGVRQLANTPLRYAFCSYGV